MYNSFALTGSKGQAAPDKGGAMQKHNEVFVACCKFKPWKIVVLK